MRTTSDATPRALAPESFHVQAGSDDTDTLIEVLGELRRFLGGEQATLVVSEAVGPPKHGDAGPAVCPATLGGRDRLPAYAPDLNPVEGLWSSLKAVELANLAAPTLAEVIDQAHRGIQRVRRTPHLAYSFLRHAGLSVS